MTRSLCQRGHTLSTLFKLGATDAHHHQVEVRFHALRNARPSTVPPRTSIVQKPYLAAQLNVNRSGIRSSHVRLGPVLHYGVFELFFLRTPLSLGQLKAPGPTNAFWWFCPLTNVTHKRPMMPHEVALKRGHFSGPFEPRFRPTS